VTPDLVSRVRKRLDRAGHLEVKIYVSGGMTPERIREFAETGSPVDGFGVGSAISGATPIDFTADLKTIGARSVAKRGRKPGMTENARLSRVR
jgi:nicotinate phosphoribosyltransferase